jgi:hypothetical protein
MIIGRDNIRRGSNSRTARLLRRLCIEACMVEYAACLAIAEENRNTLVGIIVICGIIYLTYQTGGGALILVPAVIYT